LIDSLGRKLFSGIKFKLHNHHEHIFPRKDIKFRKQLVAMDTKVDLNKTGIIFIITILVGPN
jgi:UPF0176 protein